MKLYNHFFVLFKTESIFIGFCFSWQNHEHKIQTLEKISQYHQGKWTWVLFLFFQKLLFWSCFSTYRGSSRYMDSVYADSLYASSKFPRKLRNGVEISTKSAVTFIPRFTLIENLTYANYRGHKIRLKWGPPVLQNT